MSGVITAAPATPTAIGGNEILVVVFEVTQAAWFKLGRGKYRAILHGAEIPGQVMLQRMTDATTPDPTWSTECMDPTVTYVILHALLKVMMERAASGRNILQVDLGQLVLASEANN